jgi:hypothetical protein
VLLGTEVGGGIGLHGVSVLRKGGWGDFGSDVEVGEKLE